MVFHPTRTDNPMSCLQVKIAHVKQTEISMFETNVPEAKRLQVNLLEGWFRMRFRMWWVRAVNKLEIGFPIVAEDDFEVISVMARRVQI